VTAPLEAIRPAERVLPTLNPDGSRRWIRPKPSQGRWFESRRRLAYVLMVVFFAIPYVHVAGKPLLLIDLPRRQFTIAGITFLPTDALLFMLLMLGILLGIVLLTATLGRVWCGWACPQTVYMEFLFRPIERWLEGGWMGSERMDRERRFHPRRALKIALYLALALFLAHTFLAYFVPVRELLTWMTRSPVHHPTSFFIVVLTTALILFDFGWFREQTCMVACPYGRLQSVLLDRRSVIVGYDRARGEPRAKGIRDRVAGAGDCIDCRLCVITCPTGIDIREGLQMECIHCTQCMDACDRVMRKVGKPEGLVRYGTRDQLEGTRSRLARPRIVLYPLALALTLGLFFWLLGTRTDADVTLLRGIGAPFAGAGDDSVTNQVRVKIVNRGGVDHRYTITLAGAPEARLVAPFNPLPVEAGGSETTSLFVVVAREAFEHGERVVTLRIDDGHGFHAEYPYRLVGPERIERDEHDERDAHDAHDGRSAR
jgi:cytochrome c oxidase accessory protein FixG